MAYAIIELGGKQYRVEKGDSVLVDRVDAKEGAKVTPKALLYRSDDVVFEGPLLDKIRIDAVVAEHVKGEKVRIFKYRPKKRYRKRAGHRSLLSRLEIKEIHGPALRKPAAKKEPAPKKEAAPKGEAAETKPAAKRRTAAKKES
jgi:large subunit ribosomal protein L21